jgi:hypothetical protein
MLQHDEQTWSCYAIQDEIGPDCTEMIWITICNGVAACRVEGLETKSPWRFPWRIL